MDKKIKLCNKHNYGSKCPYCDAGVPTKKMIAIWNSDGKSYMLMEEKMAVKLGLTKKE